MSNNDLFLTYIVQSADLLKKFSDCNFSQNFYASLCNNVWLNTKTNQEYSFSWRGAAKLVSGIRKVYFDYLNENYLDYYCTGLEINRETSNPKFVEEGIVTPEISECMESLNLVLIRTSEIYDDEYFKDISLC